MQKPKEEVRQAILSAAEEEILQAGYRSCSVRSIAARAGISPGNIYAYFSGKEEILDCILRPALGGIHGVMESPFPDGSPGEMVRQVTGRLAEVFLRYRRPCLILATRVEGTPYEPVKEQLGREIAARAYKELLPHFPQASRTRLLAEMMGDAFLYGMLRLLKQEPEDEGQMRRALESFLELMCGILRQDAAG